LVGRIRARSKRGRKKSDLIYVHIAQWVEQSKADTNDLPDVVTVKDFDTAWAVFTQLNATDWRHLPYAGGLLDQPEQLWNDVITIAGLERRIRKLMDKPKKDDQTVADS